MKYNKGFIKIGITIALVLTLVIGAIYFIIKTPTSSKNIGENNYQSQESQNSLETINNDQEVKKEEIGKQTENPNETMKIKVYFGDTIDAQSCFTPSYVERIVPKTIAVARASIEELLKGPTETEKLQDYWTGLRSGISIKSISINSGVLSLDLSTNLSLNDPNKGTCGASIALKQIENTLKQFSTVKSVVIKVNGQPAENSINP